jgi:hypothetical protein
VLSGDCVVRSIAIATAAGLPYQQIYDLGNHAATYERTGTKKRGKETIEHIVRLMTSTTRVRSSGSLVAASSDAPETGSHFPGGLGTVES